LYNGNREILKYSLEDPSTHEREIILVKKSALPTAPTKQEATMFDRNAFNEHFQRWASASPKLLQEVQSSGKSLENFLVNYKNKSGELESNFIWPGTCLFAYTCNWILLFFILCYFVRMVQLLLVTDNDC
jgi:hypothetical protein